MKFLSSVLQGSLHPKSWVWVIERLAKVQRSCAHQSNITPERIIRKVCCKIVIAFYYIQRVFLDPIINATVPSLVQTRSAHDPIPLMKEKLTLSSQNCIHYF